MSLLARLYIVKSCPNCESAWDLGEDHHVSCIVCGNRKGEITGWVWGILIDPFCWIGHWIVNRNIKMQ